MSLEAARFPSSVGILGAGAVGSYLGGLLVRAGVPVRFVARGEQALALAARGLTVTAGAEEFRVDVDVSEDVASLGSVDVVLLTVKSSDTEAAAAQLLPHMADGATVVSVQNGVRNWEQIAKVVAQERVLAGVAMFGVEFLEPGHVTNPLPGPLILGDPTASATSRLTATTALIGRGVTVEAVDDIQSAMWSKLVINTDMAVLALTGSTYPNGLLDADVHAVCRMVMEEALNVIRAAGLLASESIVSEVMQRKLSMLQLPLPDLRTRVEAMNVTFTPSTLQSVLRGRPSETPYLNGEVVALADKTGQHAPINRRLARLMDEARLPSAFMAPAALRATLTAPPVNHL